MAVVADLTSMGPLTLVLALVDSLCRCSSSGAAPLQDGAIIFVLKDPTSLPSSTVEQNAVPDLRLLHTILIHLVDFIVHGR